MEQTLTALRGGSHVLCEKPAAATPKEAVRMQEAAQAAGRHLAIGYQWSYSRAVQDLKRDILQGRFGRPVGLKSIVLWPRDAAYYHRAPWAGRMQDGEGRPIRDSVANNATAHYLHTMFFLLGAEIAGFWGIVVAVPVAAILKVTLEHMAASE
jgi:predicted dehydrogenase